MSVRRETPGQTNALEGVLAERGLPCRVETRAGLAVLIVSPETMQKLGDAEVRRMALAVAREHGYTHVAIELRSDARGDDASLPRA
jgi:hypothetical protein